MCCNLGTRVFWALAHACLNVLAAKPRASQKFQAEKPTHPEQRTAAQLFSSSGGSTSYKAFVNSICICINIVQYDLYNMGRGLYTRTP